MRSFVILLSLLAGEALAAAHPPARASSEPPTKTRDVALEANALRTLVSNQGHYALDHSIYGSGLEYPAGSGKFAAFAGGIWFAAHVPGDTLLAICEFGSDFMPGAIENAAAVTDTPRTRVFSVTPYDTSGWSAWVERAAPLGAPTDASGTKPLLLGDQTMWTAFNDFSPTPEIPMFNGVRYSVSMGIEVHLTAWAFHREGPLDRVAYLSYEVISHASQPLDSLRIGMFFDPYLVTGPLRAACDTSLDTGYSFHVGNDQFYGDAGPSIGLAVIDPPEDPAGGSTLRPSAFVAYPNGTDPGTREAILWTLTGRFPWGASIIDSSTMQPTTFYSSGDPVSGTGFVHIGPRHPHTVLSMGPCSVDPGDTLRFVVALVIGQGSDELGSVTDMRATIAEAKRHYEAGFNDVPPHVARALRAWPTLAEQGVRFSFAVGAVPEPVEIRVVDVTGRRIRSWPATVEYPGTHERTWDGLDDDGRRVRPGLYFLSARVGGRESLARVAFVR